MADILNERFTLKDLILRDKVANERKSLKDIILEMEDEVLANAGVDVFEEVFKLIFTKLYDESLSRGNRTVIDHLIQLQGTDATTDEGNSGSSGARTYWGGQSYEAFKVAVGRVDDRNFRVMEFRNTGQTDSQLKAKIQGLFDRAMKDWPGVFPEGSTFELSDSHLAVCVSSLQDVKLFNSNLLVVDEAFEYLVNKSAKGEKGTILYAPPRH